jgi:hypothetical protein
MTEGVPERAEIHGHDEIFDDGGENVKQRGRRQRIIGFPNRRDVVSELASTDFLQGCTLLHTRRLRLDKAAEKNANAEKIDGKDLPAISCNRDALLALPLPAYQAYADALEAGFIAAADFLNEQKIIWHRGVPYLSMSTETGPQICTE